MLVRRRSAALALLVLALTATAGCVRYRYPVPGGDHGDTHSSYQAADIFRACGALVVAPVDGRIIEIDRVDDWRPATDRPRARGGKSVAIRGDDHVRHYLAHFSRIRTDLEVGDRVRAGRRLGRMGSTGRSSACHTHYGISRTCPEPDWWVRRGVVWPQRFLEDWRDGEMTSPRPAVRRWARNHRGECSSPAAIGAS